MPSEAAWIFLIFEAQWTCVLFSSSKATISAVSDALSDPALAELGAEGNRRRREGLRSLISSLARADALKPGLSQREAVDRAWMLTGLELYLAATDGCRWSDRHYERWLDAVLAEQLPKNRYPACRSRVVKQPGSVPLTCISAAS